MSLYTTGELAKKCNVSVRTIQYYDERGILVPTDLTEGGRRLFSEEDVATLETICFVRDLDISIKDIAEILESEESKKVIELLLDEQEKNIQADVKKKTKQLENIKGIRSSLASFKDGSQKTIHDISSIMEEKEKFRTKKKQKEVHMGYGIAAVTALIVVFTFVVLMQNQSALNQVKQQLNTIQTMNRSHPANQDKTIVETQKAKLTPCPSTVPPTQENTSVPSVSPTPVPSAPAQNGVAQ